MGYIVNYKKCRMIISDHALARMDQRFGWDRSVRKKYAKEVCDVYFEHHRGASITLNVNKRIWKIKGIDAFTCIVTTVHGEEYTDYSMRDWL